MHELGSTRRDFLKRVGVAAGVGAVGLRLPAWAQPPEGETPVLVRRDVATLDPAGPEMRALAAGVAEMKRRSLANPSNPLGWERQARIHLERCPHGNWFFLPWHRAYLLYFERICREASGQEEFALPYWNWTQDPQLPGAFWATASPLFDSTREIGPDDTADPEFVGCNVIERILTTGDFLTFASAVAYSERDPETGLCRESAMSQRSRCGMGILESTPHNYIHNWIGGNMVTFMSPRDPIFWLHHANIDRLWTRWNEAHANTTDARWLDFAFENNFFDTAGDPVPRVAVSELLDTYEMGYRYDTQPASPPPAPPTAGAPERVPVVEGAPLAQAEVRPAAGAVTAVTLQVGSPLRDRMRGIAEEATPPEEEPDLRLAVTGVEPPARRAAVRVFVNKPALSAETQVNDPHYVGTFTFFEDARAHEHGDHGGGRTFLLDLSYALNRLGRAQRYDPGKPLEVQFVTVPLGERRTTPGPAPGPVVPKRVAVFAGSGG